MGDGDGDGDSASRIYVGNLIPKANEVHLKTLFARFGVIHNIWVARKPPGFAFVSYESSECAKRAVEAFEMVKDGEHAMEILGKHVKVQMAGEKEKKRASDDPTVVVDKNKSSDGSQQKRHSSKKKNMEARKREKQSEIGTGNGCQERRPIVVVMEVEGAGRSHSRQAVEDAGVEEVGAEAGAEAEAEAEADLEIPDDVAGRNTMTHHAPEIVDLGRRREAEPGGRVTIATAEVAERESTPEAITAGRPHAHETSSAQALSRSTWDNDELKWKEAWLTVKNLIAMICTVLLVLVIHPSLSLSRSSMEEITKRAIKGHERTRVVDENKRRATLDFSTVSIVNRAVFTAQELALTAHWQLSSIQKPHFGVYDQVGIRVSDLQLTEIILVDIVSFILTELI